MKYWTTQPIAKEALPFAAVFGILAGIGASAFGIAGAVPFLACLTYTLWFFRNPDRPTPRNQAHFLAPADGTVVATGIVEHPAFPNQQALRIAIFMSLFNVHMNWAPCDATVENVEYYPGKFLNAMEDKSSEENERKILTLRDATGEIVVVKLVAGMIARRIVSPLEKGDNIAQGEKIGLIRFGSRVELLVPAHCKLCVRVGQKTRGGVTVLASRPEPHQNTMQAKG
ncbi:MAG: phosphatidylserine decarboxylase proenzyme [Candidatus Sumerlaea sp.]|nr:phosphatidylserine decarboxylase family protein [Candidatus Sumerlaea chitinivorans]GIX44375.1 MAG: phosphatidylserine decarboxylase proenzyme [Candidatus Sumerlaea sp.]